MEIYLEYTNLGFPLEKKKREMKKREKRKEVSLQTWQNILILYFNNARIQEQNDLSQSF